MSEKILEWDGNLEQNKTEKNYGADVKTVYGIEIFYLFFVKTKYFWKSKRKSSDNLQTCLFLTMTQV